MQDGARKHDVHGPIGPGQGVELPLAYAVVNGGRGQFCHQPGDALHCGGIAINGVDVEIVRQQKWQVAPTAAPRIQDASAIIQASAQQLIEEIDIDVTEPGSQPAGDEAHGPQHTGSAKRDSRMGR
jgi:hypothetical protein